MSRKYPIAIATAAVVAGGVVAAPGSSGQGATTPDSLSLTMRHREAKVAFVDEAPRMTRRRSSESPGDSAISRGILRDAAGGRAGRIHGVFVVTGGRSPRTSEQVTTTIVLRDGQITLQGVLGNARGNTDVIAITGGTGRYEGADGSALITSGRRAVNFALRFAR